LAADNEPPAWHDEQARLACAPVSAKPVVAWLKVAPNQFVVLWQTEQSVGKPTDV
jgi:hypothetical protein